MKCDIFLMILNSKKNTKGKSRKWNLPFSFKSLFFYILVYTSFCSTRPERAKALKYRAIYKAFALTGRLANCYYTQGVALG